MFAFVEGILEESSPLSAIINVQGVGYSLEIPVTTAEKLPTPGSEVRLWVHPVYREDTQSLYGFIAREDRDFFRLITDRVSGIGPKIALSLLSKLSLPLLQQAIHNQDVATISQCPGIGKKTAERVCIELRDKIGVQTSKATPVSPSGASSGSAPVSSSFEDAVAALLTLGYKMDAADKSVRRAMGQLGDSASTEDLIKAALR